MWQELDLLRAEFGGDSSGRGWTQDYSEFLERSVEPNRLNSEDDPIGPDAGTDDFKLDPRKHSYEFFDSVLRRHSLQRGVSVEDVLGGIRRYEVVDVRRAVLKECSEKMDVTLSLLSRWLGMKENAAAYLLKSPLRIQR